jgi:hypothetical protein
MHTCYTNVEYYQTLKEVDTKELIAKKDIKLDKCHRL